jgi:HlyD family secretion protein
VDLDRLEARGRWLRRGALLLILAVAVVGGVLLWRFRFAGSGQESGQFETLPVSRGLIRATIASSGTAEANDETQLQFGVSGRVEQILVTLGQDVKSGDALAVLESGDLKDRLATAQGNLAVANIRLRQLLKGASEADLAAADQAVATAQATLSKAQNDLYELQKGASEADLAAAEQAVAAAQSNLDAAEAKQKALIDTPSASVLAAAQAAVTSAQAARTKAQNDLDTLLEGASDANIATAEGAVASAQANLDAANARLAALQDAPSDADKAAAQAAVAAAQANVTTASNLVASAQAGLDSAEAVLRAAGAAYCNAIDVASLSDPLCPFSLVPLDQPSVDRLLGELSDSAYSGLETAISTLVQANSAYVAAKNTLANAQAGLTSAQAGLTAAQAQLDSLGDIPAPEDIQAAQAAVTAAQEGLAAANANLAEIKKAADPETVQAARDAVAAADANVASAQAKVNDLAPSREDLTAAQTAVDAAKESLQAAQAKYQDIQEGADASTIQVAEDAVASAEAAVNAAVAKRDKVIAGAEPEDIDLQRQQVNLAQIAVSQAQRAVDQATLKAPYDGSVSAVGIQVGDYVSSIQSPAITMLTPGALKLDLAVGETDLPSLRVGMVGLVTFDALQGKPFPVVITRIGLGPKVSQGVVTYDVECAISGLGEGPADRPTPGMNGTAIIVTEQHQDVLLVPNRAIRRRGNDIVVDVMVNGKVETRPITVGLADTDNTEVLSGLAEGDLLALPSGTAGVATKAPAILPEGIK